MNYQEYSNLKDKINIHFGNTFAVKNPENDKTNTD